MTKAIGNNIDYSGTQVLIRDTKAEIKSEAKEKRKIVNQFLAKGKQLNAIELDNFERDLRACGSIRAMEIYFKDFIYNRI